MRYTAIGLITLVISSFTATILTAGGENPNTRFFPATGAPKGVALILLGGSEGGLPDYYDTDGLTEAGYPCLIVGYFRTQDTPDRLEMIPLEYFAEVIREYRSKPGIDRMKLVVWGGSKGGELALLLASRFNQIKGVIAVVPSAVVFQGLGGSRVSSWSWRGESVPFVPYPDYDWSKIVSNEYVEMYRLALKQSEEVTEAMIRVEDINGPILLLSGREDTMWPSSEMSEMIVERLQKKGFSHQYWHFDYEHAGHTLNDGYMMGGSSEGNREAKNDSKMRVSEFLERLSNSE